MDYKSERFEFRFKNKEVRMGIYLTVPTFIIGSIIIFYGKQKYQYSIVSVSNSWEYLLYLLFFFG